MGLPQGRYTKIEFNSSDAQTAAEVSLYDDQQSDVTLAAHELLLIDSLNVIVGADITVDVFADADGDGSVDDGERLASVGEGTHVLDFDGGEGLACPTGLTPSVHASGAGAITVVGTGRIINNRTEVLDGRPSWREADFGQ